ncbi:MAG: hypothetical protein CMF48_05720 [Legionellales bacterium]|nr:hypothetical protein [Legionellales bacterium]
MFKRITLYMRIYAAGVLSDTQFLKPSLEKDGLLYRFEESITNQLKGLERSPEDSLSSICLKNGYDALVILLRKLASRQASAFLLSTKASVVQERHNMVANILTPWIEACYYMKKETPARDIKDNVLLLLGVLEKLSEEENDDKIKQLTAELQVRVKQLPMSSLWLFIVQSFSTDKRAGAHEWPNTLSEVKDIVKDSAYSLAVFKLFAQLIANLTQMAAIRKDGRIPMLKDAVSKYVQTEHYREKTGGTWLELLDTYTNFYTALVDAINEAAERAGKDTLTDQHTSWLVAFRTHLQKPSTLNPNNDDSVPVLRDDVEDLKLLNGVRRV